MDRRYSLSLRAFLDRRVRDLRDLDDFELFAVGMDDGRATRRGDGDEIGVWHVHGTSIRSVDGESLEWRGVDQLLQRVRCHE